MVKVCVASGLLWNTSCLALFITDIMALLVSVRALSVTHIPHSKDDSEGHVLIRCVGFLFAFEAEQSSGFGCCVSLREARCLHRSADGR